MRSLRIGASVRRAAIPGIARRVEKGGGIAGFGSVPMMPFVAKPRKKQMMNEYRIPPDRLARLGLCVRTMRGSFQRVRIPASAYTTTNKSQTMKGRNRY